MAAGLGVRLIFVPTDAWIFPIFSGLALLFGVLLIIPIGGADMPTVIALLNSYAGLSASAMGFVLNNKLLIVDNATALMSEEEIDGALVGGASLDPKNFTKIVKY